MAYVSPSTKAVGALITAAIWNQDVVANLKAMAPDIFTTAGDIGYATAADTMTRLGIGTTGQGLTVVGGVPAWATIGTSLDRDVTVNEVVSTLAETTVYTFSIPANTLSTNKLIRLALIGDYFNNSGASRNFTAKVTFGGSVAASIIFSTVTASASRRALMLQTWISGHNATNAQRSTTECTLGGAASAGAPPTGVAIFGRGINVNNGLAIDGTGAITLAVTFTHSASDANLSAKCFAVQTEVI